jgi:cytochrome c oxidase subunit 1
VYFFLFVVLPMMRGKGEPAPQQPWDGAEGLEWEVPSPAPFHTFETPPMLNNAGTKIVGAKVPPHIDESSVGVPA